MTRSLIGSGVELRERKQRLCSWSRRRGANGRHCDGAQCASVQVQQLHALRQGLLLEAHPAREQRRLVASIPGRIVHEIQGYVPMRMRKAPSRPPGPPRLSIYTHYAHLPPQAPPHWAGAKRLHFHATSTLVSELRAQEHLLERRPHLIHWIPAPPGVHVLPGQDQEAVARRPCSS